MPHPAPSGPSAALANLSRSSSPAQAQGVSAQNPRTGVWGNGVETGLQQPLGPFSASAQQRGESNSIWAIHFNSLQLTIHLLSISYLPRPLLITRRAAVDKTKGLIMQLSSQLREMEYQGQSEGEGQ